MAEVTFSSEMTVKLVRAMASDDMVIQAAQVSSKGENKPDTVPSRLIMALVNGKHGSPFEHNAMTFFVKAPLFVFREWQRHRISSFNEMSGRYTELLPEFYIPSEERNMFNSGTKMRPNFDGQSDEATAKMFREVLQSASEDRWFSYQGALRRDVAPEVARMLLPLNIYSQMYWTVNARSLMNFLSLRSSQEGAAVSSYPQREIQMAAEQVEAIFAELMPVTYSAFLANGRVAP